MKLISKIIKTIINNIFLFIIFNLAYYVFVYNILVCIASSIITVLIYDFYLVKKKKLEEEKFLDFQINTFIKNVSLNCLSNNFNIIDAIEKTIIFLEGEFLIDIEKMISNIKTDYNYEQNFIKITEKYNKNKILKEFMDNLLVIKEQSNIDESANKIFEIASIDAQKYIVNKDKIYRSKNSNFKNYLINTLLGYIVLILIVISLNTYYVAFSKSIYGLFINIIVIILSNFITIKIINTVYKEEIYE